MSRRDVQTAGCVDAARAAVGSERGVLCQAGPQCGWSRSISGGGGGRPGYRWTEWKTAPGAAGPGESQMT